MHFQSLSHLSHTYGSYIHQPPHHILVFFFQGSGVHRDLHSFPTRRSSDLSCACAPRASATPASGAGGTTRTPRDQKSTRLNSSHVAISYAVFCLKKKTQRKPKPCRRNMRKHILPACSRN